MSRRYTDLGPWDLPAMEFSEAPKIYRDKVEFRLDGPVLVEVWYRDGKVVLKGMNVRIPPWKAKAQEWLDWLRGLVRW